MWHRPSRVLKKTENRRAKTDFILRQLERDFSKRAEGKTCQGEVRSLTHLEPPTSPPPRHEPTVPATVQTSQKAKGKKRAISPPNADEEEGQDDASVDQDGWQDYRRYQLRDVDRNGAGPSRGGGEGSAPKKRRA